MYSKRTVPSARETGRKLLKAHCQGLRPRVCDFLCTVKGLAPATSLSLSLSLPLHPEGLGSSTYSLLVAVICFSCSALVLCVSSVPTLLCVVPMQSEEARACCMDSQSREG